MQVLPRRRLQDGADDETESSGGELDIPITVVKTFQQLLEAWTEGATHIELQGHMDSTGFPLIAAEIKGMTFNHVLPPQLESTKTIMVRCSALRCKPGLRPFTWVPLAFP